MTFIGCALLKLQIYLKIMLHELGYFLNGDLNSEYSRNKKEIQDERMKCILAGTIQEQERKADAFAIKHVGKNTFNRTIDYLIRARQKRNDKAMQLAIREFELRKKAARKL